MGFCCSNIILDKSTDGGASWQFVSQVAGDIAAPGLVYPNTQFRDGIEDTFAVGRQKVNGRYPLYTRARTIARASATPSWPPRSTTVRRGPTASRSTTTRTRT